MAWYAFIAPKGTPDEIIQSRSSVINQALREEAIATRIGDLGSLLRQGMSAEAVGKAIGVSPRSAYRLQRRARELGWTARASDYESEG